MPKCRLCGSKTKHKLVDIRGFNGVCHKCVVKIIKES